VGGEPWRKEEFQPPPTAISTALLKGSVSRSNTEVTTRKQMLVGVSEGREEGVWKDQNRVKREQQQQQTFFSVLFGILSSLGQFHFQCLSTIRGVRVKCARGEEVGGYLLFLD
jgi:hypothetical protein